MKKFLVVTFLVVVLLVMSFSLVMAKTGKVNLEGQIIAVDEVNQTITIRTADLEEFTIHFAPEEVFGFSQDDVGTFVHIKGTYQEDGSILAEWVKPVDEEDDAGKEDSAYCSGEKETAHPVAIVLANKFNKDVEEIMGYFCEGFGIGQIYLALQTEKISGVAYGDLLAKRAVGLGWGEIWKELGYNGKPKDPDKTPPGQEKDQNKDKTPPGQNKDKGPDDDDQPKEKDKQKDKEKKPKKEKDK